MATQSQYQGKDFGHATRSSITRMVGTLHVSEPDEAVKAHVLTYLPENRFSKGFITQALNAALAAHHANQKLFKQYRF